MHTTKDSLPKSEVLSAKVKGEKYIAILLITISVVGLIATPSTLRWLILLEGLLGVVGIVLFIHSRLQFWRGINKQIK
jgi:NADH:ubiquinone oxidoreductase subunit K